MASPSPQLRTVFFANPNEPSHSLDAGSVCALVSGIMIVVGFAVAGILYLKSHRQTEEIRQRLRQKRASSPTVPIGNRQGSVFATGGDMRAERTVNAFQESPPPRTQPHSHHDAMSMDMVKSAPTLAPQEDFFAAFTARSPIARNEMMKQMENDDEL